SDLLEVVLDLGRPPEARFLGTDLYLDSREVTEEDLQYVVDRIGSFGDDNRAGIPRTLHRFSAIRNRRGKIVGITCRVGRAVFGTIRSIQDFINSGKSILLLGRPGVGKTTMLREAARVLAEDAHKRVIVVDTSNEIAGDGDIPHPAIGRARRMQVPTPTLQHAVMIEAVENHMPEVIVIDEIGTELEAQAARTIAERGVQLIATAHGNTLENLMLNPTLTDLIGGIQTVTLGDEEARRRGTQKSVLERKAPPTFDVVVEIQSWNRVAVHESVAEVVDNILRGQSTPPAIRYRDEQGEVKMEGPSLRAVATPAAPAPSFPLEPRPATFRAAAPAHGKPVRLFPYGLNRSRLEQLIRGLQIPATLVANLQEADVVMTVRNYYRRKTQALRDAEAAGVPVYVLRSTSNTQLQEGLARVTQMLDTAPVAETPASPDALVETQQAITQVLETSRPVELSPQDAYVRRLQHQLAEQHGIASRSTGKEPYRRVKLYKR
ncbi:MAG: AAA family ATPase, partial [Chloroflexi bacterium]|nr:AAA family ATPase [Chloroflexota bacterium]